MFEFVLNVSALYSGLTSVEFLGLYEQRCSKKNGAFFSSERNYLSLFAELKYAMVILNKNKWRLLSTLLH